MRQPHAPCEQHRELSKCGDRPHTYRTDPIGFQAVRDAQHCGIRVAWRDHLMPRVTILLETPSSMRDELMRDASSRMGRASMHACRLLALY